MTKYLHSLFPYYSLLVKSTNVLIPDIYYSSPWTIELQSFDFSFSPTRNKESAERSLVTDGISIT